MTRDLDEIEMEMGKERTMKAQIRDGAKVGQDHGYHEWHGDTVFDVAESSDKSESEVGMMKPKKVDRMMTEAKILTMISRIVEMWGKSQGPCECTVHKRSGDIIDLCPDCSVDCALEEISSYIAEQYEAEALS